MADIPGLTEAEQKYFDTKGTDVPTALAETPAEPEKASDTPKAETAKEPDKAAEADKTADPDPEPLKVVDKRALDEERNRRKELQKRLAQRDEEYARLSGRLDVLQGTTKPEAVKVLDPTINPIEVLSENDRFIREFKAREEQNQLHQQFMGQYSARVQEFAKTAPDFKDAYDFAIKGLATELQMMFGLDGIALENAVRDNERQIVGTAMQRGINPAEQIYQWAKGRGYTGVKPADPTPAVDPGKATADALLKATTTLQSIQKGQEKSKSLSSAGGAGSDGMPPIEELVNMPDDEFDKLTKNPRAWKKIASGS